MLRSYCKRSINIFADKFIYIEHREKLWKKSLKSLSDIIVQWLGQTTGISSQKVFEILFKINDSKYISQSLCIKIMTLNSQSKVVILYTCPLKTETWIFQAGCDKLYLNDTGMYLRTLVLNMKNT